MTHRALSVARLEHKLGIKASDTAVLLLQDCRIPADNILGSPEVNVEQGFAGVMQTFDNTRPLVAAMAVGVGRAALEELRGILTEAGVEISYDTPVYNQHAAAAEFIRLEADWEAAYLLSLRAAWMADNKKPNSLEASMSKAKAGRTGTDVTLKAVELAGTYGYSQRPLLEKWGARLEDSRHLRGHPADPAADRRTPPARKVVRRTEVTVARTRSRNTPPPPPFEVAGRSARSPS